MALTLEQFLNELVELMKHDFPVQFQRMTAETDGLIWLQTLDNEKTLIRVTCNDVIVGGTITPKKADVRIKLPRKCLFELLEGKTTLEKALQTGRVEAIGKPATLLKCFRIFEKILLLSRLSPRFYFLTYKLR